MTRNRRYAALIIGIALLAIAVVMISSSPSHAAPRWEPCKYEDGSGQSRCVWDARRMGNGEGNSLIIRNGGTDCATYTVITHRRAHRMLNR